MNIGAVVRRLLGEHRGRLAAILGLSAVGVALNIAGPLQLGRATDVVVKGVLGDGVDLAAVTRHLVVALALYAVAALLLLWQGRLAATLAQDVAAGLRNRLAAKLHRLPVGYFTSRPPGELIGRTTSDVETVARGLELAQPLTGLLTVVGALVMMLVISPLLALILVLSVPAMVWVTGAIAGRARAGAADQMASTGRLFAYAEEQYTGHRLIRLLGRHEQPDPEFAAHNDKTYQAGVRMMRLGGLVRPATGLITSLGYALTAFFGLLMVSSGSLTLGGVQALLQYSAQCSTPVAQLGEIIGQVLGAAASAQRIFEVLDADEQTPDTPAADSGPKAGHVVFEDVTFGYDASQPVVADLSFAVEPGQTVALVGPTGAGKTTIAGLLVRLSDPDTGRILLDGIDTAVLGRAEVRSRVAMVAQDSWLFHGTVADNIAYGRPDATLDDVTTAARAAHLHDLVLALPDGYDTVVGGDDDVLSAGEKQLITVARAFVADPSVLILDEATSAVDTRTEALIQQGFDELRRDRTSLVIAHRLSTIRDADQILVLRDGRITERGDHASLLAADGHYARMYADQFSVLLGGER